MAHPGRRQGLAVFVRAACSILQCLDTDALLLAALHATPRRHRLPPLPADVDAARAAGIEATLAFAIDGLRQAVDAGRPPPLELQQVFTEALAARVELALREPPEGDPAFQAALLRAEEPAVDEHVRLADAAAGDRRSLRLQVDAIAHPGKLARHPEAMREGLARLHRLAESQVWPLLRPALAELQASLPADDPLQASLAALQASPALQRLERAAVLLVEEPVQRYRVLSDLAGPAAGSAEAQAQGQQAAQTGAEAEQDSVQMLERIAALLQQQASDAWQLWVPRNLRMPRGFPGEASHAKAEWDAAIVASPAAGGPGQLLLLVEVKSSPAAAGPDLPRLVRGLQRLAQAEATQSYELPSADGPVRLQGASLRRLLPAGAALPPQVVYFCQAARETRPGWLTPASRAQLLAQPATLAFGQRLLRGEPVGHPTLLPAWQDLASAPRLRSVLLQGETLRAARECLLRPSDLLYEVSALISRQR